MLSFTRQDQLTNWFIFQDNKLIFIANASVDILSTTDFKLIEAHFLRKHYLGTYNDTACYCAEVSTDFIFPFDHIALTIRGAFERLGDHWFPALARSQGVLNWDKLNQFCGACGAQTIHQANKFERLCSECGSGAYPRISPSAIVLIHRNDEILLARGPNFAPGRYGLIAGFVEVGESIEETIHREVYEEVGLTVHRLKYFNSQSWPFPDSLMIGFTAAYKSGEIKIDNEEIIEAGWFRYDQLPGYPSKASLARKLIDHFIAMQSK